jgi:hypothetical protein
VTTASSSLPRVDEHAVLVDADLDATWSACQRVVDGSFGSVGRTARLLGCEDTIASGPRPLAAGSTLPGFHIESVDPKQTLALAGGHRFSDYALIFRLDEACDGTTTVRAETRARFPGVKGGIYKALVIRTRGHVLVTRRLLKAMKRRAERT